MEVNIAEIGGVGLRFASGAELVFALGMLAFSAFFGLCALYLCRLLLAAFVSRKQVVTLSPSKQPLELPAKAAGQASLPGIMPRGIIASDAPGMTGVLDSPYRFVLLIPAHNEELLLGAALDSLQQMDYPRSAYEIVVVADNCSDKTAEIARTHGAVALERFNKELIGKGYALEWALQRLLAPADNPDIAPDDVTPNLIQPFDAIIILDADTQVSPNLLRAFANGLAAGQKAMQARYDVLNIGESWRTKLMTCALALAHVVKSLGRERLALSDGLKGNGMCFAREVVEKVPWSGESITEDIEYTLRLCRAGYRVAFLPEACVWAQMPTTGAQATSQRKRWEGGRYRLLFTVAPGLMAEGIRRRSRTLCDRAMEMIIPPFAEMFAVPILLLAISLAAAWGIGWHWATGFVWVWLGILALQALYLFGGMAVARVPASVAFSLLYAPVYILWKFGVYAVMAVSRSAGGWKRTERHNLTNDERPTTNV